MDSAIIGLDTCSKKKHAMKEEGTVLRLAELNGAEKRWKGKPVANARQDHAATPVCPVLPKWKRSTHGKNLSQTHKDKKEHKGGKINGHVVQDCGDIKHTKGKLEELAE